MADTKKDTKETKETAQQAEVNIISKMSVKTLRCNPKTAAVGDGEAAKRVPLCRIYGNASEIGVQEDRVNGKVYNFLKGMFEGQNLQNGEIFRSGKLYLPGGIHETIEKAVKDTDGDVAFALEVSAVSASNAAGYSYEARPLVKPVEADPLQKLRESLPQVHIKQLAK